MDDDSILGDMVMISEEEFNDMELDLMYWTAATGMLSDLLTQHGIEHEVNEQKVKEFLQLKREEIYDS